MNLNIKELIICLKRIRGYSERHKVALIELEYLKYFGYDNRWCVDIREHVIEHFDSLDEISQNMFIIDGIDKDIHALQESVYDIGILKVIICLRLHLKDINNRALTQVIGT